MTAFERLCERTQRWDELGHRLEQKASTLPPPGASRLWYGVGRVSERLEDLPTARAAYERSASLDPNLVEPVIALRRLASRRGDWTEVARLLDLELALGAPGANDPTRLVELASIVGERLGNNDRALALLERARAVESSDPAALDLLFRFAVASEDPAKRKWELAAQALERLLAGGAEVPDAADRYFRVAADAEAAGRLDEALVYFSRSYSRNANHRPTLERLSFICFEKGQWDNAWRATEAHARSLSPDAERRRARRAVRALGDVRRAHRAAAGGDRAAVVDGGQLERRHARPGRDLGGDALRAAIAGRARGRPPHARARSPARCAGDRPLPASGAPAGAGDPRRARDRRAALGRGARRAGVPVGRRGRRRERALRLSDRGRRHRDARASATPRPASDSTRAPARRAPAIRG